MPVIRLQVDVDSDVYPELYAALRAIERPGAREERVRQLAASGLVWEVVRRHGQAAVAPASAAAAGLRARTAGEAAAAATDALGTAESRADIVDAGSTAPQPSAVAVPAAAAGHRVPKPTSVPVLLDVVEQGPPHFPLDEPPTKATDAAPRLHDGPPTASDAALAALPPPMDSGVYPPGPRSARLRRMADRGLFKNG
ncbi:hypothetical protein OOT46_19910 [Aquabacterium sp. A7-Y]|uniref:hypothetical protein n=1 Tax=Aquabacterium sp. A7-Y TaxID=1349605 RepID=UPI00223D14EA|nr:hypothetical protein [Aquabacterium sp. A7-Y]MCW7540104.1 hypothetical protein [Aquabacterium sp. A7-Y]